MRLPLAILFAVMIVGCSRAPSLLARLQSAGGEAALKKECQSVVEELQKTQREFWTPKDSALPPTIAALQPLVVQATSYGSIPMVDILVSEGSSHHGLLVVLTNTPPEFMPSMSMWRVTKIADGVYEYRE